MIRKFWTLVETLRLKRNIRAIKNGLAPDLGVPADVSRVLEQTATELRQLSASDETADARPIINKAVDELAKHQRHSNPAEEAWMEQCLGELPERDLTILRHFKRGKKHREIAALMNTSLDDVRRSLVKTYADLRMKMRGQRFESIEPPTQDVEQILCVGEDKHA